MKPICEKCLVEYRVDKNGVAIHFFCKGDDTPHREMQADRYKCPVCGHKILTGFGEPMYDPDVLRATRLGFDRIYHMTEEG